MGRDEWAVEITRFFGDSASIFKIVGLREGKKIPQLAPNGEVTNF